MPKKHDKRSKTPLSTGVEDFPDLQPYQSPNDSSDDDNIHDHPENAHTGIEDFPDLKPYQSPNESFEDTQNAHSENTNDGTEDFPDYVPYESPKPSTNKESKVIANSSKLFKHSADSNKSNKDPEDPHEEKSDNIQPKT